MPKKKVAKGCKSCPIYKNKLCKGVKILTAQSCKETDKDIYKD